MALRSFYFVLALSMLIASGCKTQSNYRSTCAPTCAPAPCPPGQVPPPPPPAVLVPR